VILFDPEKKRTGVVQAYADGGVLFDQAKEGFVGMLVALFENVFKITAGLMGVDDENEMEWGRGWGHESHL
jgi:hypothetical protein